MADAREGSKREGSKREGEAAGQVWRWWCRGWGPGRGRRRGRGWGKKWGKNINAGEGEQGDGEGDGERNGEARGKGEEMGKGKGKGRGGRRCVESGPGRLGSRHKLQRRVPMVSMTWRTHPKRCDWRGGGGGGCRPSPAPAAASSLPLPDAQLHAHPGGRYYAEARAERACSCAGWDVDWYGAVPAGLVAAADFVAAGAVRHSRCHPDGYLFVWTSPSCPHSPP